MRIALILAVGLALAGCVHNNELSPEAKAMAQAERRVRLKSQP